MIERESLGYGIFYEREILVRRCQHCEKFTKEIKTYHAGEKKKKRKRSFGLMVKSLAVLPRKKKGSNPSTIILPTCCP